MNDTTPQCPEDLYDPETDTLLRCIKGPGRHEWHQDRYATRWRDPMADVDFSRMDNPFSSTTSHNAVEELAIELMTSSRSMKNGKTDARWLLHELERNWLHEAAQLMEHAGYDEDAVNWLNAYADFDMGEPPALEPCRNCNCGPGAADQ